MKELKFLKMFVVALVAVCLLQACTNEDLVPILGCTETDALNFDANATNNNGTCAFASKKIVGEWRAELWKLEGTDFVCSDFVLNYDFQEDGHFEYTFTGSVIPSFIGYGNWGLVGEELQLDYGGEGLNWRLVSAFYPMEGSTKEHFSTKLAEGNNKLTLGMSLEGKSLAILFNKKKIRPIDKDDF